MSDIWRYFDKIGDKAKCKLCKKVLARSEGSTTSVWKHLKTVHPDEYNKLKGTPVDSTNKVIFL